MISIEQINGEIAALEEEKPTFAVMNRLADLYTVRDHMSISAEQSTPAVFTAEVIPSFGVDSDFSRVVVGRDCKSVMLLMNELMLTLQALNPRLYESVMDRLL